MSEELKPCREAFEAWYSQGDAECPSIERADGKYKLMATHTSWQAWETAWNTRSHPTDADSRLDEMSRLSQDNGEYDPPFDNPLIKDADREGFDFNRDLDIIKLHLKDDADESVLDRISRIRTAALSTPTLTQEQKDALRELVEAGRQATTGTFELDTGGEIITQEGCTCAFPKDEMFKDGNFISNTYFFTLAANLRPLLEQIVGGE